MNIIHRYLDRSVRKTHIYEGWALLLLIEIPALVLTLVAAPTWQIRAALVLSGLVGLDAARAAQTSRSGSARKAEAARAQLDGRPVHEQPAWYRAACEAALEDAAARSTIHTSAGPIVGAACALASGVQATALLIVGAAAGLLRAAWALWLYPAWRASRVEWRCARDK